MSKFLKNEIDYDSPLKHVSYLEFNSYVVGITAASKVNDYQKIKKLIDEENCKKISNVVKKLFQNKENDEKMVNYLVFGFPRCYFDSLMFDIQIISLINYNKLKLNFESQGKKNTSISGVFTNYIGFKKLNAYTAMNDTTIGIYYVIQSYNDITRIKVLKKLVINWETFDPSFCSFRKSNFIEPYGPEFNFCKNLGSDLSYYLDIWVKNYITTELYFYKYLCDKAKNRMLLKKKLQPDSLKGSLKPTFKLRTQQKAINFVFVNFTNPSVSKLLETKFFWKRSHLEKYVSWISYKNDISLLFLLPSFDKNVSRPIFTTETIDFLPKKLYNSEVQVKVYNKNSQQSQNHFHNIKALFDNKRIEEKSTKKSYKISNQPLLKNDENIYFLESFEKGPELNLKQKFACFNNYKNCEILIQNLYKNDKKTTQLFFKKQFLNSTKVWPLINGEDLITTSKQLESRYLFSNNWISTFEAFWIFFCDYIIFELEEYEMKFNSSLLFCNIQDHSLYFNNNIRIENSALNEIDFNFLTSRKHEKDILNVDIVDTSRTKRIQNTKNMAYKYWSYVMF